MVYMFYNKAPFVIIAKKGSGITKPQDLEGKTVGSPPGAAALKLFPALAKNAGVDNKKIQWVNMSPQLQEQMLLRGDVQASLAFINTSWFNFKRVNVDPEKDLTWLFYSAFGLDLYSNGVMVSKKLALGSATSPRAKKMCSAMPSFPKWLNPFWSVAKEAGEPRRRWSPP